jgi:hypothetical protein
VSDIKSLSCAVKDVSSLLDFGVVETRILTIFLCSTHRDFGSSMA